MRYYDLLGKNPAPSGLFPAMPREHYDLIGYFSSTVLKKWISLQTEPEEFRYWLDHRDEDKDKEWLLLGSALDCYLLEPDNFKKTFAVAPKCDRRTKEGKAKWEEFCYISGGFRVLSQAQNETVKGMADALMMDGRSKDVFKTCRKVNLITELQGFPCKSEVDLWMDNSEHIMDLKTCRDVSPKGFWDAFYSFGYRYQAAFYLLLAQELGFEKTVFDFACVKNTPPYTVRVFTFAPDQYEKHRAIFEVCREELSFAMGGLDVRLREDNWKSSLDWRPIDVPAWAIFKLRGNDFSYSNTFDA
jgi:exodeoxyribonuclease VIII